MQTLMIFLDVEQSTVIGYLVASAVGLAIYFAIARWAFAINKRVKQNTKIISLLTAIAKQAGASNESIYAYEIALLAKELKNGNLSEKEFQDQKAKFIDYANPTKHAD